MSTFSLIRLFLILIGCSLSSGLNLNPSFGCPGFETVPKIGKTAPRLILSKFPSNSVQQTGRDIVIKPAIVSIHLDCWASYPIDLEFSGQLTNQRAEVRTFVTPFTQADGLLAHCYHINVSLTTYKEITGNYSCFDVQNPALVSSRFIFAQSPPSTILLRSNETVTVMVKPGQKSVILPCAISNPAFAKEVQLLRVKGKDPQWILESKSLKYDPKIGFIMTLSASFEKDLGLYECRIGSPQDIVKVKLEGPPDFTVFPITKRALRLKQGDRLVVECLSKSDEVMIKAFPELEQDPEAAAMIDKQALFHNRNLLSFYNSAEILVTKTFTGNGEPIVGRVECVRKSNNEMLYQWQYRVSNESRNTGLLDPSSFLNSCPPPKNSSSNELDIVLYECDNWVACKMSQCLRNDSTCRSNNHCVKRLCMPNGIIQCPSETGVHAEIFFTGFNDLKYTNWRSAETKDLLRILPTMENPTNSGILLTLMCEGTNFVLAGGFKWSLHFKNGTIVDLTRFGNDTTTKETWGETKSILRNSLTFSTNWTEDLLKGSRSMLSLTFDSITCSAPIWNSTEWINQTILFQDVSRFMEKEREDVAKSLRPVLKNSGRLMASLFWLTLTGTLLVAGSNLIRI